MPTSRRSAAARESVRLVCLDQLADGLSSPSLRRLPCAGNRRLDQHLSHDGEHDCARSSGLLRVRRQSVDDAVVVSGSRVAGCRTRCCLCGRHGHGDGLGVAQLADQNHVRSSRIAARTPSRRGYACELALDHLAFLLRCTNRWVLEADDVHPASGSGGRSSRERGRLARA